MVLGGPIHSTMPYRENCSDNGSVRILVQVLMDKTMESLSGLKCTHVLLYISPMEAGKGTNRLDEG